LKFGALFGRQLVGFAARFRAGGTKLMIGQKRFATMRAHAIGPAGQLHLQNAEIDPELQFLPAIQSEDFAHFDRAVLVRPILQNRVQIQTHAEQMIEHLLFNCQSWRADAWDASIEAWSWEQGAWSEEMGDRSQRQSNFSLVTRHLSLLV